MLTRMWGSLLGFIRRVSSAGDRAPVGDAPAPPPQFLRDGPLRVLLVEDNENLRVSLKLALELDGLIVAEAIDGAKGVEQILRDCPDVAVVDLSMPGMDGFEVARRVRRAHPNLRLIAVSGYSEAADVKRAREAGFHLLVQKPIDPERLARLIRGADV